MCNKCNFSQIYQFKSEVVWKNFDHHFTQKLMPELKLIEENHENLNSINSYNLYKCNTCNELWAYSYPENAWRGFFLREKIAIEYEKKLKRGDKTIGIIGLSILLITLIGLLLKFIK